MSTRVDPALMGKLARYGAFDINACFNCGNCTAVCPLSQNSDSFPRRMIRYGQIGAQDRLLSSKEVWQCFYCGQCSDTCPRLAEPGEFMAAARRYAIASSDLTGISRLLYTSKYFTAAFMFVLSLLLGLLVLGGHGPMASGAPMLFRFNQTEGFLSSVAVHDLGVGVIVLAVLAMIVGVGRMVVRLSGTLSPAGKEAEKKKSNWLSRAMNAGLAVAAELAAHGTFRECDEQPGLPWYRGKRFVHWSIMWGFIGLLVATAADWLLEMTMGKAPGQPVSILQPTRLLGTVAGVFVVYGTAAAIIQRWTGPNKYFSHSLLSDWLFLWLLFLTGVTGFAVEVSDYFAAGAAWMYVVLLLHVVVGMEVVILLPFTKFAHAIYRPVALFVHNYVRPAA
jgi:nitrate reductase gamma subunit/ferredoxin